MVMSCLSLVAAVPAFFCGACPLPFLVRRFSRHVCYGHCPPPSPLFPPPSRCRIQIVQTASTEPGTHVPLSRSFTLLFGLTAATAGLTAVTTLFGSSSAIAHAAATAACACLAGATLGTLPAAAAVVFPEAHRGTEKTAAFVAGIAAVAAGVAAVTGAGIGAGVAELLPVGGGWLMGGLLGGGGALLLAAAGRATRDLGGRGGAAVLAVAVLAGGGVAALWTWVEPYVEWFFLCGVVSFGRRGGTAQAFTSAVCGWCTPVGRTAGWLCLVAVGDHLWLHPARQRRCLITFPVWPYRHRCAVPARPCVCSMTLTIVVGVLCPHWLTARFFCVGVFSFPPPSPFHPLRALPAPFPPPQPLPSHGRCVPHHVPLPPGL